MAKTTNNAGTAAKPAGKTAKPAQAVKAAATEKKPAATAAAKQKASANAKPAAKAAAPAAKAVTVRISDKPWLKSYPKDIPAEIGPLAAASIGDLMATSCKQYAGRPAFSCMGKTLTFADLERLSSAFGAYLQSTGLKEGARVAIMMPNVLQYPVAMMAVLRAGYTVVNVNPLYTPRELEHQLKDSGAEAIVILENFATTLQAVVAKTSVKHVVVAAMGDMLGIKGMLVNFVVRRVKKMVPDWSLPGHVKFNDALKAGAGKTFKPAKVEWRRRRLPAIYRRHDRHCQGRGAAAPQRAGQCRAECAVGAGRLFGQAEAGRSHLYLRAAALSYLRADGERADGHAAGRAQRADPQSARHSGLRQGTEEVPDPYFPGAEHAVQRAAQQ